MSKAKSTVTDAQFDTILEKARREVAGRLGTDLSRDDPAMISAFIAWIVTREIILLERQNSIDNNLLSFGDVRNVITEARDEAILMSKQLLGIVFMQAKEEGIDMAAQLIEANNIETVWRKELTAFVSGAIIGAIALWVLFR